MKYEKLVEDIKKEIERLEIEKDLCLDERWESEIIGRIESLYWVLEKIK